MEGWQPNEAERAAVGQALLRHWPFNPVPPDDRLVWQVVKAGRFLDLADVERWALDVWHRVPSRMVKGWGFYATDAAGWPARREQLAAAPAEPDPPMEAASAPLELLPPAPTPPARSAPAAAQPIRCSRCEGQGVLYDPAKPEPWTACACDLGRSKALQVRADNEQVRQLRERFPGRPAAPRPHHHPATPAVHGMARACTIMPGRKAASA